MDKTIEERLSTLENLSGIFNWVYEGYKIIKNTKRFTEPDDQLEQLEAYKETQNPILVFVKGFDWTLESRSMDNDYNTIYNEVSIMTNGELYRKYCRWYEENGYPFKPQPINAFKRTFNSLAEKYRPDIQNKKIKNDKCIVRIQPK